MTRHLLARSERVVAVEIDARLVGVLKETFRNEDRLTVVHADVLETDLGQWGPAVVAGNLPYYVTSPILQKILALGSLLRRAVLLIQKEVAERLAAVPGTRNYGFLTVETKLLATPEILFQVPPDAFDPPPKVNSAVVRFLIRAPEKAWAIDDPARFLTFVGHCFRQKRKTLRNNLAGIYGKALVEAWPEASLRAEQLSIEQFAGLYRRLRAC